MNQRSKIILYILLALVIVGSIFLVWAFDSGKFFSSADESAPAVTSAEQLQSLPSPDQSTFGDWFGKVAEWFSQ